MVEQLEVCLPYSRMLAGIPILSVFQNLRWNNIKITLHLNDCSLQDAENCSSSKTQISQTNDNLDKDMLFLFFIG